MTQDTLPQESESSNDSELKIGLEEEQIKGLVSAWRRVIIFCIILAVFLCVWIWLLISAITGEEEYRNLAWFFGAFVLLYAAGLVGTLMKESWGRICGIIVCCTMLPGIPIGTGVGIFGIFAYRSTKQLFGEDALSYKDVKRDYEEIERRRSRELFGSQQ